jgi:hypothetical protein
MLRRRISPTLDIPSSPKSCRNSARHLLDERSQILVFVAFGDHENRDTLLGVEKGSPRVVTTVMGMLLGRPDPLTPDTLVVTDDSCPSKGFGDESQLVMTKRGQSHDCLGRILLEVTRAEKITAGIIPHPFGSLRSLSHCFLEILRVSLQWQRAEDLNGNPLPL